MDWSFRRSLPSLMVLCCLLFLTALIPNVSAAPTLHSYLLVASNTDPGRVLRYDGLTGAFVDAFVPTASGGLRFTVGMTIAVGGDGNLYITNASGIGGTGGGVWRYSGTTGAFIDAFVPLGSGGLDNPEHLTFGPDGNLYVTDYFLNAVLRFNGTTGAFMGTFASTGLSRPEDLLFGRDGNLYVSDDTHVVRYNGTTGAFIDNFVPVGSGGIFAIRQIAIGPDNNFYAASAGGGVYRYNGTTGAFIDVFVPVGSGGQSSIWGIEFGPDNNLYVTPAFGNNVLRFNGTTGAFMGAFVTAGSGGLSRSTDMLFINILIPNRPPAANNEIYTTNEDTALNPAAAAGVLANDTDADNDPLTAHLVTDVSSGTLSLAADGSFNYVPFANFYGSDSFTYYTNDGSADSNTATVTINVSPVNDAPTAKDDAVTTPQAASVIIFVLSNDSDIDGTLNPATVTVIGNPANGAVNVNPANGAVTYTPNPAFTGPTDTLTYTVNDNGGTASNVATVTVTITSVPNIPPTANNDTAITSQNTAVSIPVLTNDVDLDGTLDPSTVIVTSTPSNGTAAINPVNGTIIYVPQAGMIGTDAFAYTVRDNNGDLSNIATVTVTITGVNTPPAATITTAGSSTFTVPLCSDFDGQTNPVVRAQLPRGVYGIHCRIIAENHVFTRSSAEVGNQSVLDLNVIHAVDVFSPSGANAAGTQICLQGSGGLIFLDAKNAPRVPEWLASTPQNNFTCGIIPNIGIVALVAANAPVAVVSAPPNQTPISLTDCQVTITHMVRLRAEPNTTSTVLAHLAYNLVLQAIAKQDNWYRVIYLDGQGWVSGDYLMTAGNCG